MKIRVGFDTPVLVSEAGDMVLTQPQAQKLSDYLFENKQPKTFNGLKIEEGASIVEMCQTIGKWIVDTIKRLAREEYEADVALVKKVIQYFVSQFPSRHGSSSKTSDLVTKEVSKLEAATTVRATDTEASATIDDPYKDLPFRLTFVEEKKASWVSMFFQGLKKLSVEIALLALKTIITVIATHYALNYVGRRVSDLI